MLNFFSRLNFEENSQFYATWRKTALSHNRNPWGTTICEAICAVASFDKIHLLSVPAHYSDCWAWWPFWK